MSQSLVSSLSSLEVLAPSILLVQDATGEYRRAHNQEVLEAAQQVLAGQIRGTDVLTSPDAVRTFLRLRMGALPHEVFAVLHLDAKQQVIEFVEMFRGTLTQTSVYPREILKDALRLNSCAVILVHNHPSGGGQPSSADQSLTQQLKTALNLIDVRVLDHLVVTAGAITSMAELGLV